MSAFSGLSSAAYPLHRPGPMHRSLCPSPALARSVPTPTGKSLVSLDLSFCEHLPTLAGLEECVSLRQLLLLQCRRITTLARVRRLCGR